MNMDDYQAAAGKTAGLAFTREKRLSVSGLGIAGEAGEVADMLKKHIGHDHPLDLVKLKKELGDVLWYVADLATTLGMTLSDVAETNVAKLAARYPEGFDPARSLNRVA